jgi:plasmid maintenance system antidote protein VapI
MLKEYFLDELNIRHGRFASYIGVEITAIRTLCMMFEIPVRK